MDITVSPKLAVKLIKKCMKHKQVPYLTSAPGMGKSDIIRSIAEELSLKLIDVRLAQVETVDLNGFPDLSGEYVMYKQLDIFPTESTPIPDGYNGWCLYLDELSQSKKDIQGAAHKLILDRLVGQEKLHEMCFVIAAGNRAKDRAASSGLITSLQSRMTHLSLHNSLEDFTEYAIKSGLDSRIISYLNYQEDMLNNFDPLHKDETYACPRTWEKLSELTKDDDIDIDLSPLVMGTVGQAAGSGYRTFCDIWQGLPDIKTIETNPLDAKVSRDTATQYALVGMLTTKVSDDNLSNLVKYVRRLDKELQLIFLRMVAKRHMRAISNPEFSKLLRDFTKEMKSYV